MAWLNKTTLNGKKAKLIPLEKSHREGLLAAASDGKLWELWYTSVPSEDSIDQYIETALTEQLHGRALPFTILDASTNKIIGCTRYCNAVPNNRRLEIGYTWYAKSCQKTGINTECKYLLLQYAFEQLNCIAVEFKTHSHNRNSQRAISRLGAKLDGVIRNHSITKNGIIRDACMYSIIQSEWEVVKFSLDFEMGKY
ncbi:MAG: RimJ/RimL family protein N-acetyltransferase [Patescibacteria group bacterium]|jgi:RimJ/RimL family protein N-acetyltransferase